MITDLNKLPTVTFNIATYNEEKRISKCLSSIKNQSYPKEKIEIIITDGGSTDKTREIVKKFGAKIYDNEKKLAEPGLVKGYKIAQGDYVVFMAADNILYDKNWLFKMIQPFIDYPKDIYASFSKVVNDPKDNSWSQYLNEDTDPFNAFVFGNASHPDKFLKIYKTDIKKENYIVYKYEKNNYPLIALAQGTILKKGLSREDKSEFDDILPLIEIISSGKKIAYVENTGIRHYSLKGFDDFCNKFDKRIYNSMKTQSYSLRERFTSLSRKIKKYLFIPYSLSIIFPFLDSVLCFFKKRKTYLFLHPLACTIITYYIFINLIKVKILKK
jgi:glycosyltransferase involved in cell wall biosynthesis